MSVNNYKFQLIFNNISQFSDLTITEPVKFDGASFVLEQDSGRYGRDILYLNDNVDLFFYDGTYDVTENPLMLPNGTIINNLTQGFEHILEARNLKGFEAEIEFKVFNNDTEFTFGVLDMQNLETDNYSFVKCKVLQNTNKQLIKRRNDYVVDLFSNEDADGNYIEPLVPENILLKAKPNNQFSSWSSNDFLYSSQFFGSQSAAQFPIFRQINDYEIEDTLTSFFDVFDNPNGAGDASDFFAEARQNLRFINALTDLSDITLSIKNLNLSCSFSGIVPVTKRLSVIYGTGYNVGEFEFIDLFYSEDDTILINDQDYEVNIPFVPSGGYISVIFSVFDPYTLPTTTPSSSGGVNISNGATMEINLTSTAIDTVIKGFRYVDAIKQNVKSISTLDLDAKDFDINGEHYNNFVFSGNLIKGRDDVAFSTKFKDLSEGLKELNYDYQVLNDKVYIGKYEDFYTDVELASLPVYPDERFISRFNERFALNLFSYQYKTFESDKDESDTSDAVHTDTQWTIQNRQVENEKEIQLPQIRDYNKIEVTRQEASKTTTSTNDDDKMYIIDVVSLAPSSKGGFTTSITHFVSGSQLKLRKSADLPSWGVLGFGVGSDFSIISGQNIGSYEVLEIEDTIITLDPVSPSTQSFTGVVITKVEYPFSNVLYTNRTNEGFTDVEGIISGDKSSNLRYTPKRNIKKWSSYLSSAVLWCEQKLTNSYFKFNQYTTNGLSTQLETEIELLNEKSDLELTTPLLSANEYDVKLVVGFDTMVDVLNKLDTINDNNSIGGFIRCYDPNNRVIKGYIKKLEYEPATETLTATLEERFESELIEITKTEDSIVVNDVLYNNVANDFEWYEFNNDFFIIFDENKAPIINPTIYSNISLNGVVYDSVQELNQAIIDA